MKRKVKIFILIGSNKEAVFKNSQLVTIAIISKDLWGQVRDCTGTAQLKIPAFLVFDHAHSSPVLPPFHSAAKN